MKTSLISLQLLTMQKSSPSNAISITRSQNDPVITHRVKFNVQISRKDGTFYTRDDETDEEVFSGSLSFGLFGNLAPNHVKQFLEYVNANSSVGENPTPSYSSSQFTSFDQATGLLGGGVIPGLHVESFNGASVLEYKGHITAGQLWLDDISSTAKLSHNRPGLLTHKNYDLLPNFGITTRSALELNTDYTVFGILTNDSQNALLNEKNKSEDFLERCIDLPTYGYNRPGASIIKDDNPNSLALGELADGIYSFQSDLFRKTARSLRDSRLDYIFEGKLLRRVEVTRVENMSKKEHRH